MAEVALAETAWNRDDDSAGSSAEPTVAASTRKGIDRRRLTIPGLVRVDRRRYSLLDGSENDSEAEGEEYDYSVFCVPPVRFPHLHYGVKRSSSRAKRVVILTCICVNALLVEVALTSLMAFFATETLEKFPGGGGTRHVWVGIIFGIAPYVECVASPVAAKYLHSSGSKLMVVLSTFLICGVLLLFSFVNRIDRWTPYLVLCLALRITQGVATGVNYVATYSIAVGTFPDRNATINGLIRALHGMGYTIGPAFGGFVFDSAGFAAPFYVGAVLILCSLVPLMFILPSNEEELSVVALEPDINYAQLLRNPWAWVILINIFIGTPIGFAEPTLPVYFKQEFNAPAFYSGLALSMNGLVFGLVAIAMGYAIDKRNINPRPPQVFGLVCYVIAFQILGPAPYMHLPKSIAYSFVSVMIMAGGGVMLAAAAPDLLQTFGETGNSSPESLRAAVGGVYQSALALGCGTAPIVGSSITAALGFAQGSAVVGLAYIPWTVFVAVGVLYLSYRNPHKGDKL